MNITVEHHGIRSTHGADAWIEDRLLRLQESVAIEEARVRLERRREFTPAFRVSVHLVVPGPDIRVEGTDHTLDAAMRKATAELRRRIAVQAVRRLSRTRGELSLPASGRRPWRGGGHARLRSR